jgi:hypothetical protein
MKFAIVRDVSDNMLSAYAYEKIHSMRSRKGNIVHVAKDEADVACPGVRLSKKKHKLFYLKGDFFFR